MNDTLLQYDNSSLLIFHACCSKYGCLSCSVIFCPMGLFQVQICGKSLYTSITHDNFSGCSVGPREIIGIVAVV